MARTVPTLDIRRHPNLIRGDGLRVRLERVAGQTPKHILVAPLAFPAVLNDFTWEEEFGHTEYDTIRQGQFSTAVGGLGYEGRKLKTCDIDLLAMDWSPPWMTHAGYSWEDVQRTLIYIGQSKKPFRFAARVYRGSSAPFELGEMMTLRRISRVLKHGEKDTRYFTCSFVEWRQAAAARRSRSPGKGGKIKLPAKHKLGRHDTLHSLSKKFYGSYDYWPTLRDKNGLPRNFGSKTPIVKSHKFKPGSTFVIPVKPKRKPKR